MLEWVYGELSHPHLMALRIYVAFESVLVLTLLPAELAEVLQTFGRHNQYIMNNDIAHRVDHLGRKGKEGALVKGGQQMRITNDAQYLDRLVSKVEELNERAVICISTQKCEQALVYLQEAEQLLESAALKGLPSDRHIVQCILHNSATCYQNLWQLQKCSNYLQALIFNLNSAKGQRGLRTQNALGLPQYYIQFCAVNSELDKHSRALIAARKSLSIIKDQLKQWRSLFQTRLKESKGQNQEKFRLLSLVCRLNDNIDLSQLQILQETVGYYLKNWRVNASKSKNVSKQVRELIEAFSMKSITTLHRMSVDHSQHNRESQISLTLIYKRILVLSCCYLTISVELKLISQKKQKDSPQERPQCKEQNPQYKQSQIYHLLSVLLLLFTFTSPFPFINHLINSYTKHYNKNIERTDIQFKKIFAEIAFQQQVRNRETSINLSEYESGIGSYISKGSASIVRITKGSKQSDRQNKLSQVEPRKNKNKGKNTKSKSKSSNKNMKKAASSLVKTLSKESIVPHSQKSKNSKSKQCITSIKTIPNKQKALSLLKEKGGKRMAKPCQKSQYFLMRQRKGKKGSLSQKKNVCSAGKLPIDSTIEVKAITGARQRKKATKKSFLQYYL